MSIYQIFGSINGNVGFVPDTSNPEKPKFDMTYYEDLEKGISLPVSVSLELADYSRNKIPKKDFVDYAFSLLASDALHPDMKALLTHHCHTIKMISPFGDYTYYLPKNRLDVVNWDKTKLDGDIHPDGNPSTEIINLVLDETKIGDVPIFQLHPKEHTNMNYATEAFRQLYKKCRSTGLIFQPIDSTT